MGYFDDENKKEFKGVRDCFNEPYYIRDYRKREGRFPIDYKEIAEEIILQRYREHKRWMRENSGVWHERGK